MRTHCQQKCSLVKRGITLNDTERAAASYLDVSPLCAHYLQPALNLNFYAICTRKLLSYIHCTWQNNIYCLVECKTVVWISLFSWQWVFIAVKRLIRDKFCTNLIFFLESDLSPPFRAQIMSHVLFPKILSGSCDVRVIFFVILLLWLLAWGCSLVSSKQNQYIILLISGYE